MRRILQIAFLLRDKDLVRWGRGIATFMAVVSIFCFGAAFLMGHLIENRIGPLFRRATEIERTQLASLVNAKNKHHVEEVVEARMATDQAMLDVLHSMMWIVVGTGILAISHALITWRAYELAYFKHCQAEQAVPPNA